MLNILACSNDYKPNEGGVAEFMFNVCQCLSKKHRVVIAAQRITGYEDFDASNSFLKTYRLDVVKPLIYFSLKRIVVDFCGFLIAIAKNHRLYTNVLDIVRSNNIDRIIVFHWNAYGLLAFLVNRKTRVPYYIQAHGMEIIRKPKGIKRLLNSWFQRRVQKIVFSNASGIFANSEYTKKLVLNNVSNKLDIFVTYCGVDSSKYTVRNVSQSVKELHQGTDFLFLSVGRLVKRKGFDMFLRALSYIIERQPNLKIRYVIAGDGEDLSRLNSMVRSLALENFVVFLGRVSDREKIDLYNIADVFVMPSRENKDGDVEGFGIVYLEAACCATPSIGGRSGGVPSAISDNVTGWLVNPYDHQEIAKKVLALIVLPELIIKTGAKARSIACANFTWQKVAKRIEMVLLKS